MEIAGKVNLLLKTRPNRFLKPVRSAKVSVMENRFEAATTYHIFNRGNNRETIFKEVRNYYYFLGLIKKHLFPITHIICYCLVRDRFHLVVRIRNVDDIPEKFISNLHLPFSNLFNSYAKSINNAYGRTGSLFQEHFYKSSIREEEEVRQIVACIHNSPGKVYSSYNSFFSESTSILDVRQANSLFENFEDFKNYHQKPGLIREEIAIQMQRFHE
jgi:putative transposase